MSKVFWLSREVLNEKLNQAHIIVSEREEETEIGSEGTVFVAACGQEMNSWWNVSQGDPEPIFSSSGHALEEGKEICPECLAASKS